MISWKSNSKVKTKTTICLWSKSFSKSSKKASLWRSIKSSNKMLTIYKHKNRKTRTYCRRIDKGRALSKLEHTLVAYQSKATSALPFSGWKKPLARTCSKTTESVRRKWSPLKRQLVAPKPLRLFSAIPTRGLRQALFQKHRRCLATILWQLWPKTSVQPVLWYLMRRWTSLDTRKSSLGWRKISNARSRAFDMSRHRLLERSSWDQSLKKSWDNVSRMSKAKSQRRRTTTSQFTVST